MLDLSLAVPSVCLWFTPSSDIRLPVSCLKIWIKYNYRTLRLPLVL
jgi:hypothetical protein